MKLNKKKLLYAIVFLIIISPLGLLTNNPAWGEWEKSYFTKLLGFIPKGLQKTSDIFVPLFPDYDIIGNSKVINQYLSALIGLAIIFIIFYLFRFTLKNKSSVEKNK